MSKALQKAVDCFDGNKSAFAKELGVKPMTVCQWFARGVPAERVVAIEAATGGRVLRSELRPDLYASSPANNAA